MNSHTSVVKVDDAFVYHSILKTGPLKVLIKYNDSLDLIATRQFNPYQIFAYPVNDIEFDDDYIYEVFVLRTSSMMFFAKWNKTDLSLVDYKRYD